MPWLQRMLIPVAGLVLLWCLVAASSLAPDYGYAGIVLAGGIVVLLLLGPERLGVSLILAGMFVAPMNEVRWVFGTAAQISLSDVLFVLGFGFLMPLLLSHTHRIPSLFIFGAGAMIVAILITSMALDDPLYNSLKGARLVVAAIMLPMLFLVWQPRVRQITMLAWAFVIGHGISTGVALLEGPIYQGRHDGLTTHPNFFAIAGLMGFAMIPYLYTRISEQRRWVLWVAAGVMAYSISMSGSRGAMLALILLLVLFPLVERSTISAFLVVCLGVFTLPALDLLVRVLGAEGSALGRLVSPGDSTEGADRAREIAIDAAQETFWESPILGSGFSEIREAHNLLLEIGVAVGVIGVAAWLVLMAPFVISLFSSSPLRRLGYVVMGYLAIGMTQPVVWDRMAWAALCLPILALVTPDDDGSQPESSASSAASTRGTGIETSSRTPSSGRPGLWGPSPTT